MTGFTDLPPPFSKRLEPRKFPAMEKRPAERPSGYRTFELNIKTVIAARLVERFMTLAIPFAFVSGICAAAVNSKMRNVPVPGP